VVLAVLYLLAGLLFSCRMPVREQLTFLISFGLVNNVLAMIFSAQFFGVIEPLVAAMYMIPFWFLLVPMRMYQKLRMAPAKEAARAAGTAED
jgi:BASS family bile acid:Na+ symporter